MFGHISKKYGIPKNVICEQELEDVTVLLRGGWKKTDEKSLQTHKRLIAEAKQINTWFSAISSWEEEMSLHYRNEDLG